MAIASLKLSKGISSICLVKRRIFLVLLLLSVLGLVTQDAKGYKRHFHEAMTVKAIENAALSDYLIENVRFNLSREFNGPGISFRDFYTTRTVKGWIKYGSWREDMPPGPRTLHHFYNPSSCSNGPAKHLTDPPFFGFSPWPSALEAALSEHLEPWSWEDVKGYYKLALTSTDPDDREKNFAKTFRGLGQVLHLLQDMGSPAHVRNDNHLPVLADRDYDGIPGDNYENYITGMPSGADSINVPYFPTFTQHWDSDTEADAELAGSS